MLRIVGLAGVLVILGAMPTLAQQPARTSAGADYDQVDFFLNDGQGPAQPPGAGAARQVGQYWLGLRCLPVMAALRAQLNLPEKQGLLVGSVAPDSPAAKAGIKQHDVLLRAGDKTLADLRDLMQAVEASNGAKLSMELIRGGKRQTVNVTPAKRPAAVRQEASAETDSADWETLHKWMMESMMAGSDFQGPNATYRFRVFQPGAIVPPNAWFSKPLPKDVLILKPLPKNMSVSVSREGDQPAKISVKRDDQKWEVTEKELDKLPADVRPFVEPMLGRGGNVLYMNGMKAAITGQGNQGYFHLPAPPPAPETMQVSPLPGSTDPRLEKRLDEMSRRIDKLTKLVEEMAAREGRHNAPEGQKGK